MDFSDDYIEMCEAALEIQQGWEPAVGDWVQEREKDLGGDICNSIPIRLLTAVNTPGPSPGVGLIGIKGENRAYDMVTRWRVHKPFVRKDIGEFWQVWLPRQDQLQEMIATQPNSTRIYQLVRGIFDYLPSPYPYADSMEKLWLSFIMRELHGQCWNGTDWWKLSK